MFWMPSKGVSFPFSLSLSFSLCLSNHYTESLQIKTTFKNAPSLPAFSVPLWEGPQSTLPVQTSPLPGFERQTVAFFDSGAWGTAFLTPAEGIMQKKSTHFAAGCGPKHQGSCYSVVLVVKIDQMKWGEQQGRKPYSGQSRANFLHGFVSPSVSPTCKISGAVRSYWPWWKQNKEAMLM